MCLEIAYIRNKSTKAPYFIISSKIYAFLLIAAIKPTPLTSNKTSIHREQKRLDTI